MSLDSQLLAILVCPVDKGPLFAVGGPDSGDDPTGLYNPRLKRRYPVVDGIPNLLPDDAEVVDDAAHEALTAEIEARGTQPTGGSGA
jgi:uncharacterized protein YbaR (Trm112 family)